MRKCSVVVLKSNNKVHTLEWTPPAKEDQELSSYFYEMVDASQIHSEAEDYLPYDAPTLEYPVERSYFAQKLFLCHLSPSTTFTIWGLMRFSSTTPVYIRGRYYYMTSF